MLPARSIGAEIGVWQGDFSAAILTVAQPRTVHLIDPWQSAPAELEGVLYDKPQADMDAIHDQVLRRFAHEIASGTVVVHRARSADAAGEIADGSLDWAYIDGDHTYEGVSADLAAYAPKLGSDGLLCGDDYVANGRFGTAVKRAVDELVARGEFVMVAQRTNQFVLRRVAGKPHD